MQVLSCVLLTLVDITGMIHFWGLTIDTISCVNIVLGVGLCVDYSAHIAHAFIVSKGKREMIWCASLSLNCMWPHGPDQTSNLVWTSSFHPWPNYLMHPRSPVGAVIACLLFRLARMLQSCCRWLADTK